MPLLVRLTRSYQPAWETQFLTGPVRVGRSIDADVKLHPTLDVGCDSGIHAEFTEQRLGGESVWVLTCLSPIGLYARPAAHMRRKTIATIASGSSVRLDGPTVVELGRRGPQIFIDPQPKTPRTTHQAIVRRPPRVGRAPLRIGNEAWMWRSGVIVALGLAAASLVLQLRTQASSNSDDATSVVQTTLNDFLDRYQGSVYQVGIDRAGSFEAIGTAWVAAEGILATNAHVARTLFTAGNALDPTDRRVARRAGERDTFLVVQRSRLHPGWDRWQDGRGYIQRASGKSRLEQTIGACDVALLYVDGVTPEPLPLASAASLLALAKQDPVGYIGFPAESLWGLGDAPDAAVLSGEIIAMTDLFRNRPEGQADAYIINHNIPISGGASGSPLIDGSGRVIGLISSGSFVFTERGGRAPTNFNFAQRADLLRELLDGTADQRQAERDQQWAVERRRLGFMPAADHARAHALALLGDEARVVAAERVSLDRLPYTWRTPPLGQGKHALVVVSGELSDIDLAVAEPGETAPWATDLGYDHAPEVVWTRRGAPAVFPATITRVDGPGSASEYCYIVLASGPMDPSD